MCSRDHKFVFLTGFQAVRSQISEAQKIAGGSGSEQDIAEAKIELEASLAFIEYILQMLTKAKQVLESLQAALK